MNKVVLKEFEKKYIIVDIIFYGLLAVLGFVLLNFGEMGLGNPIKHAPCIFYTIAFFAVIAYFVNRRKDDYEFLLFAFINVVVATFILVYTAYPDSGFILADAVLLYSIANILNKGYSCKRLIEHKDMNFFTKISITLLLLFLGVFVVASLYDKVELGIIILGYYFITFGLLSMLEPLNEILLNNPTLKKQIFTLLAYDKKEEKKEEVKEVVVEKEEVVEEKPVKKTVKKAPAKKAAAKKTTAKKTTTKKAATKKTTTKKTTSAKKTRK